MLFEYIWVVSSKMNQKPDDMIMRENYSCFMNINRHARLHYSWHKNRTEKKGGERNEERKNQKTTKRKLKEKKNGKIGEEKEH